MEYGIDDATVQQQAGLAGFETVKDYVVDLLQRDRERLERQSEIRAALDESSADIAAGRTRPYADVMADIRKKHELS